MSVRGGAELARTGKVIVKGRIGGHVSSTYSVASIGLRRNSCILYTSLISFLRGAWDVSLAASVVVVVDCCKGWAELKMVAVVQSIVAATQI